MPIIDATYAETRGLSVDYKSRLMQVFAKASRDVLKCEPKDVQIRLHPVKPENYGIGGWSLELLENMNTDTGKPIVQLKVELYPGRPDHVKDTFAAVLTKGVAEVLGVAEEQVEMDIVDTNPRTNYVGGKLFHHPAHP